MRFKIERYTLEEGEIEADTLEDAVVLLKYRAFPKIAWMTRGKPTMKLKMDDERDLNDINSKSKRSN